MIKFNERGRWIKLSNVKMTKSPDVGNSSLLYYLLHSISLNIGLLIKYRFSFCIVDRVVLAILRSCCIRCNVLRKLSFVANGIINVMTAVVAVE